MSHDFMFLAILPETSGNCCQPSAVSLLWLPEERQDVLKVCGFRHICFLCHIVSLLKFPHHLTAL